MIAALALADVPRDEVVENLPLLVEAEIVEDRDAELPLAPGSRLLALPGALLRRVLVEPCPGLVDEGVQVGLDSSGVHGLEPYCPLLPRLTGGRGVPLG